MDFDALSNDFNCGHIVEYIASYNLKINWVPRFISAIVMQECILDVYYTMGHTSAITQLSVRIYISKLT